MAPAAPNTLGPSNIFGGPFEVYNHPTKGFDQFLVVWNTFGMSPEGFWAPRGAYPGFRHMGAPQGPSKHSESTWITKKH